MKTWNPIREAVEKTRHQSVRDYIGALKRGDAETVTRVSREVISRNRTSTDPSELMDLCYATATIPFGSGK